MWLSSSSKSSGVKKRSPKTSAMALSAATLESLFPAPTRILVVFLLSEASTPDNDHLPFLGLSSRDHCNHIVLTKVGIDAARIVGDDHRLPHPFDTQGLAEGAVRIKPGIDDDYSFDLPNAIIDPPLRV